MWNWFNCYLSGRHEFGVWCAPGAIFLRCLHCGKRSEGIAIEPKLRQTIPSETKTTGRVVPFPRAAASS